MHKRKRHGDLKLVGEPAITDLPLRAEVPKSPVSIPPSQERYCATRTIPAVFALGSGELFLSRIHPADDDGRVTRQTFIAAKMTAEANSKMARPQAASHKICHMRERQLRGVTAVVEEPGAWGFIGA